MKRLDGSERRVLSLATGYFASWPRGSPAAAREEPGTAPGAGRSRLAAGGGAGAVGKTALTVRFITKRFIGDYDPTLEMIYRHTAVIDGEMVHFEILDTAGQEEDSLQIEEKIKWGDGFAVVYSVTDRCSFDEVMRLCFLINHIHASPKRSSGSDQPPVVIIGNKKDLQFDRMVSSEDGENLSKALKYPFYEISTRDSYEETVMVFNTLYHELMRQGHFSPGSFKRRTVSKLMEKIPRMHANSTLNSGGRSLSFNSFRDYIPDVNDPQEPGRATYPCREPTRLTVHPIPVQKKPKPPVPSNLVD
ncbi:ras-related and estrogen-regulated growth inhibitor-like [Alligator sinensis]|uniref:small monomeric GTPase n=1 Tax=Alligator sinensis TaxID=38654 RepID=A0A1U7R8R3_ALLSI|nr:ras-related and estrogen-regulated growth inhibitor-like [Alligator sinensis]